ncbi:MAG: Eco57I restriction-modification methylase domain-containing protein [Elusimicrobiales bacterium]
MDENFFLKDFNKNEIKNILIDKFLPEDFTPLVQKIPLTDFKLEKIKEVELAGKTTDGSNLPLSFLFIKHTGINDPRITLTRESFKIIKSLNFKNTIAVFYSDGSPNYRISLITFSFEKKGDKGVKEILSNPKRYSYLLGPGTKIHTPTKNILAKPRIKDEKDLKDRFSLEVVTKEFYQELANWYFWALKYVEFPKDLEKETNGKNIGLIRFITRFMFVWFMKRKGLISENLFDKNYLNAILKTLGDKETSYYTAIIQNLFFATLNTKIKERRFRKDDEFHGKNKDYMDHRYYRHHNLFKDPEEMKKIFNEIPFLNGGLFECLDKGRKDEDNETGREIRIDGFSDKKEKQPVFPNFLFFSDEVETDLTKDYNDNKYKKTKVKGLINILNTYNFTIDENSSIDVDVSLDPELLGRVFENLLASYNPETATTARKSTGSYYTPREIVDYMVEESLKEYFKTKLSTEDIPDLDNKLESLFSYEDEKNPFNEKETDKLIQMINELKVIDPAVGSGAFPMGMLQKLVFLLSKLDPHNKKWKEEQIKALQNLPDSKLREEHNKKIEEYFSKNELNYGRKLYLIQNCLYGVDIQPIAIQIAKLRFFLSLLVDEKVDKNADNFGIEPLPNLETKLVSANTLIGLGKDDTLMPISEIEKLEKELFEIRREYFIEPDKKKKDKLKKQDKEKRLELKETAIKLGSYHKHIDKIVEWDLYNTNKSSDWFDSEWMFGIKDGFDIVIANPPYGDLLKKEDKKLMESLYKFSTFSDISSPFIERSFNLLKNNGNLVFIITYAITFSKDFSKSRYLIAKEFAENYIYTFDRDKCRIFESMSQSVSIIKCFNKGASDKKGIFTSRMFRETPNIYNIEVTNCDNYLMPKGIKCNYDQVHRLPKIGETINKQILEKLLSFNENIGSIIKESGSKIWIRTSGNYWYNAFNKKPYNSSEISELYVDNDLANFLILIVNSSLFYFWFRIYGDGRHMNDDVLKKFPLPNKERILKYRNLLENIKIRIMKKLSSVFDRERKRFLTSNIKSEIDLIDLILGIYFYNLDYNEISHILNYDSEVRGGNKLEEKFRVLLDNIIELKNKNKNSDTTILEKQIDQIVYQLYDLTPEEIKIIENER